MTRPAILAGVLLMGLLARAAEPPSFPDDAYVTVLPDGHLQLSGQRVRFWGWIGHFWLEGELGKKYLVKENDPADVVAAKVKKRNEIFDALAARIKDLGFNLVRLWFIKQDWTPDYRPGDGSIADLNAYALQALDRQGIRVWMTAFNDFGTARPEDADLVDDPASAEAWRSALREMGANASPRNADVGAWDPRMRAVHRRQMQRIADWPNHYKGGLRLGDDPQMAVWELSNEEWMFNHLVNGAWQKLPKFFKDELQAEWTAFLKRKYATDQALASAWMHLLPGESLERGNVLLAPLASKVEGKHVNDANPAALEALTATRQAFTRDDFTRRRGEDVMQFFSDLQIRYKTDRRDHAKTLGKSLKLCPMLLDTGDGFRIQSVWMHQHGDAYRCAATSGRRPSAISRSGSPS